MKGGASIRRLGLMMRVISRHAFIHLLSQRLARWPNLALKICGPKLSGPQRFRRVIEEIGGTFIKFGQMLALQSDLLPLDYCRALFSLFDQVEPFEYKQVEQIFVEDLHRKPHEIFSSFDPQPIATGSIGQVHVATLGEHKLAVKVRRPTILSDFDADITALSFIVRTVKLLHIRALYWIIAPTEEFVAWTQEELDFRREGHYMDELGHNAKENACEKVPLVFWSYTTAQILTAEYLEGVTISEFLRERDAGRLRTVNDFDPRLFAGRLIDNFLGDAFRHGMFHADLHPGNLMIMNGNVVGYIDFGISGVLSRYSRRHLIAMTLAYARGDLDAMCESFFRITTFDHNANLAGFRQRLREVSANWYGLQRTQSRLRKSITSIMLDLLVLSRECGVWPQRDVIKYIRSAIALDGLVKTFSPGMDIGRQLEMACERHIKWDSMRNLVSPDAVAGWFGGYTNLVRDGALRAMSALRRLSSDGTSPQIVPAHKPKKQKSRLRYPILQSLWIGIFAFIFLKPPAEMFTSRGFWWTVPFFVAAVSMIVWRMLKHGHTDKGRGYAN
ncbi:MAG TPA: AarF/UbiB family protein [Candidatus Angelobacter sp.]|nr:AarF/UbiB family protein [Candidatus Angelobacter sp.]